MQALAPQGALSIEPSFLLFSGLSIKKPRNEDAQRHFNAWYLSLYTFCTLLVLDVRQSQAMLKLLRRGQVYILNTGLFPQTAQEIFKSLHLLFILDIDHGIPVRVPEYFQLLNA